MSSPQFKEAKAEVRDLVRLSKEVPRNFDKALRGYVVAMMADMVRENPDIERIEIVPVKNGNEFKLCLDAFGRWGRIEDSTLARHAEYMTKAALTIYGGSGDADWEKLRKTLRTKSLPPDYAAGKGGFESDNKNWLAEVGPLPSYRIGCEEGSLRVSLDYLPDCDRNSLWFDVDLVDHSGHSLDSRASAQCNSLSPKSTPAQRRTFVKEFAELLAPLVTSEQSVRSWEGLISAAVDDASLRGARAYVARVVAATGNRTSTGHHSKP